MEATKPTTSHLDSQNPTQLNHYEDEARDRRPWQQKAKEQFSDVPAWAKGLAIAGSLFLLRRPILKLTGALIALSTPFVVPLVVAKVLEAQERQRKDRPPNRAAGAEPSSAPTPPASGPGG